MRIPHRVATVICICLLLPSFIHSQEETPPSEMAFAYTQGIEHFDQTDWPEAALSFQQAIAENPQKQSTWYNLAVTYFQMNDFLEAERHLEKLFELNPFFENAQQLYGMTLYRRGDYARAIKAFNYAIYVEPKKELLLARAISYIGLGEPKHSLPDFDEILHNDPGHVKACLGKSAALMELGQYNYAQRFLNRILDNDEENTAALTNRAICHFQLGEDSLAIIDFEKALSIEISTATLLARAKYYLLKNQLLEAMNEIKTATQLTPNAPAIYFLLGQVEMKKKEWKQAIDSFDVALEMDRYCLECYLLKSEAQANLSNYDQAVDEIYKVLEMAPNNSKAKEMLLWIYAKMDKERS
ncbi:MAG: tetratricopeptide repeat protein [Saprospiraceae bacterium]